MQDVSAVASKALPCRDVAVRGLEGPARCQRRDEGAGARTRCDVPQPGSAAVAVRCLRNDVGSQNISSHFQHQKCCRACKWWLGLSPCRVMGMK